MTPKNSHLRILAPYENGRNFLGISSTPESEMTDAHLLADIRSFSIRCEDTESTQGWVWRHADGLIAEAVSRGLMQGSALCLAGLHAPPKGGCHCMRCGKGPAWMRTPLRLVESARAPAI